MIDIKTREPLYYTVAETAHLMAVSKKTVYKLIQRGELPARRFCGALRVPRCAVAVSVVASVSQGRLQPPGGYK